MPKRAATTRLFSYPRTPGAVNPGPREAAGGESRRRHRLGPGKGVRDMAEENKAGSEPTEPQGAGQAEPQGEPRTFTQEDVNRLLGKERAKYKGFAELKKKAEAYDELQEQGKTELERATARAEKAESELAGLKAERERAETVRRVAKEAGVSAELLAMMRGDSEDDLRAAAKELGAAMSSNPMYPDIRDNGGNRGAGITREQIEKTKNPAERVRLRAQNPGLYQ